jgi:hypothetical protein
MLGGGHVRRRSIGSLIAGSPCVRVEKRKHAAFQEVDGRFDDLESPRKTRLVEKPSAPSSSVFSPGPKIAVQHNLMERQNHGESCFVGNGEDTSTSCRSLRFIVIPIH